MSETPQQPIPEQVTGTAPAYGAIYAVKPPTHPLAVTSLVLSIVGFMTGLIPWLGMLLAIGAIITGHLAITGIQKLQQAGQPRSGKGMAIAGLVVGYATLTFTAIMLFITLAITTA